MVRCDDDPSLDLAGITSPLPGESEVDEEERLQQDPGRHVEAPVYTVAPGELVIGGEPLVSHRSAYTLRVAVLQAAGGSPVHCISSTDGLIPPGAVEPGIFWPSSEPKPDWKR